MPVPPLNRLSKSFNRLLAQSLSIPTVGPEISDRIVSFDVRTLERRSVNKRAVVEEFLSLKNKQAANIVEKLPARNDGALDANEIDRLLVTVHCEMQRISEEFQHGGRVADLLNPILEVLRERNLPRPLRVVDVGCGTGFVARWLSAHNALGSDVELIGADYHAALVSEAQRLASAEKLSCSFVVANAFRLAPPAAVYISTGILHHFRGSDLIDLFAQHSREETAAFVHFDFHPSALAPLGSWLFHVVRMREPLAKHDGVLSAVRAHSPEELLSAARAGAPDFVSAIYGTELWGLPIPRAFHCLVGILPEYREAFVSKLGSKIASLGVIE
jgi:SAM-dependent methyltransferase